MKQPCLRCAVVIFLTVCLQLTMLVISSTVTAGEIRTYTDKDGNTVISNTPPPDNIRSKPRKIDSYRDITDRERLQWEKEHVERKLDEALKDCLASADTSYDNAWKNECRRRKLSDNCALPVNVINYLAGERETWKAECRRAARR